jgi:CHAD domain-containing protein
MKSPKVSLRRHETLRGGLIRIFGVLTDAAPGHSDRSQNDEQTTYRVRTTIKRLRSLLRLIRPGIEPAFFDRENERLRTAARLLSSARDSEVARDTVKTLPVSGQSGRQAVNAVLSGLETRIERAKAHEPNLTEVKKRLEETRSSVRRLKVRGTEGEILEAAMRAVYRQGRKRMKVAIQTGQDGDYHRWRIRAKNLYYELQF